MFKVLSGFASVFVLGTPPAHQQIGQVQIFLNPAWLALLLLLVVPAGRRVGVLLDLLFFYHEGPVVLMNAACARDLLTACLDVAPPAQLARPVEISGTPAEPLARVEES